MRPAEFTPEAIIEAGQALQAAGRNITGFALRQRVGGGNPARLKQVWDEYINSRTTAKTEPVAELPVEVAEEVAAVTRALTERIAVLAVGLNDKAVKAAERRVAEVVRAAGEQRVQAERELADAAQTVDDLEATLSEAKAEAEGLAKRLADAQANNQAQAVELAQLRERLALTEQAHQDQRKQAAQEAHRAAERMIQAQTERDTLRKEAATAREEAARLRGQVEILQTQAADLMRALAALHAAEGEAKPATPPVKGKKSE